MAEERPIALFAGSVNPGLADDISKELGVPLGNVKLEKFANGEIYARYQESVRGKEVFLIQSVCCGSGMDVNDALMELLIMADAAKRASAHNVSAVIAHYGYARQDRKAAPREPITAKLVADLLEASGVDNVITIDLHQDAIQGFFNIPVNHMTAMGIFVDYYRSMGLDPEQTVVVSPDVGRAKAAKKFSTMLDCDIAIMHKDRPKHNQAEITALIGDVTGMLCDGAKADCALKIATCTNAAMQAALMAMRGIRVLSTDGIVEDDVEKTISNFAELGNQGSVTLDQIVLDMMLKKEKKATR